MSSVVCFGFLIFGISTNESFVTGLLFAADLETSHHQRVSELQRLRSVYVFLFVLAVLFTCSYYKVSSCF